MSRPQITTGAIHTPDILRERGYLATEQRMYADGTCAVVAHADDARHAVLVWDRRYGTSWGHVHYRIRGDMSPAHLSAAVRIWRTLSRDHAYTTDGPCVGRSYHEVYAS